MSLFIHLVMICIFWFFLVLFLVFFFVANVSVNTPLKIQILAQMLPSNFCFSGQNTTIMIKQLQLLLR